MSWQLPGGYFGSSSAEDEWMMQEILQLLASEDPNSNRMETVSTPESSQPSLGTTTTTNNNSSSSGIDSAGDNSNSITDLMRSRGIAGGNVRASGANVRYEDCNEDEEKQPAERRPAQQGSMQRQEMSKEGRDTAQQVPYPS
ncbi:hypothetical protein PHYBOEH_010718 [Phytophthora boehmeriae]|uniref:Uncharacterized protein n=1 Tax=Phytophthora boehmeriae TaxID=109152 RepID=A0A8T1X425_9STRA|nr:hypothetical protein PHYBOEH_010718 [Phytophthora boehmeriae]